jgi:hypothetical protein
MVSTRSLRPSRVAVQPSSSFSNASSRRLRGNTSWFIRVPDLNHDLLKEILTVGMLEGVRVDHFEEDSLVARQPLVEDAIPLAV